MPISLYLELDGSPLFWNHMLRFNYSVSIILIAYLQTLLLAGLCLVFSVFT